MLDDDDLRRYARQIVLPEIGGRGQARLAASRVLIVGAGGLGSPLALYLAAAGIGRLGIVDDDRVQIDNLHRQIAFSTADVGRLKVEATIERVRSLNPTVALTAHPFRLEAGNAEELLAHYDVIADGNDDLTTRIVVHDTAMALKKPLVAGAVQGMDGQLTTWQAYLGAPHPCLHCLLGEHPDENALPTCAQGGVLGPVAGVVGTLQAVEVIKACLDMPSLSGRLVHYDALRVETTAVRLVRRATCTRHRGT
ncbi:MAG: HesA/MoeB/ThiF family protein [Geminicoccaceae bacterium]|nr:HesA/MoeB/ThiF family protein [Geminicoccaceae bacterium]